MPTLDRWFLLSHIGVPKLKSIPGDDYFLAGRVTSDELERFDDGTDIYTSKVIKFDLESKTAVTKSGTKYTLQNISHDYEEMLRQAGTDPSIFNK